MRCDSLSILLFLLDRLQHRFSMLQTHLRCDSLSILLFLRDRLQRFNVNLNNI